MPVDIVPFGGIADQNSNIQWPPLGDVEMDVAGFDDAHRSTIQVQIQQDPLIQIPVASPQGLALLKIIAWDDRDQDLRPKDAKDLAYLLESYQVVGEVAGRIYEIDGLMQQYDWDIDQGSAHLLGVDTLAIAGRDAATKVSKILQANLLDDAPNYLVEEMCSRAGEDYDNKRKLLEAFSNGFHS